MRRLEVAAALAVATGCAGTGPSRPLATVLAERGLEEGAPVVLVDIDDTIYERAHGLPLPGAAESLQDLADDHLIVYLTARPTVAKIPGVTHNRKDSREFLEREGFPGGVPFTSSLWNFLFLGQGGGKVASFERLRDYGIDSVALAVGDRPHDLAAYTENESVSVERSVIVLIEGPGHIDRDRRALPTAVLEHALEGEGSAWPRILHAYEKGALDGERAYVVSQPPRSR